MDSIQRNEGGAQPPPMTAERLAAIERRVGRTTPGPWGFEGDVRYDGERPVGLSYFVHATDDEGRVLFSTTDEVNPNGGNDLLFASYARTDIPDLLAEVASLRDTIRLTRNVLAAAQWTLERSGGVTVSRCELCGATREQGHDEGCTYRDALELLEAAL